MKRMTKWWPAAAVAAVFGVGFLSCGEDALLKIDVDGDSLYSSVQLRLAVKGTSVQQSADRNLNSLLRGQVYKIQGSHLWVL